MVLKIDEAIDYIKNNVKVYDTLEVSYNRIFAPGEVLNLIPEDEVTEEGFRIDLQLNGEVLSQTVTIDFDKIRDDLLEFRHIHNDDEEVVVEIDFEN